MSLGYAEKLSYREDVGAVGQKEIFDSTERVAAQIRILASWVSSAATIVHFPTERGQFCQVKVFCHDADCRLNTDTKDICFTYVHWDITRNAGVVGIARHPSSVPRQDPD
jgi:hypothetical protein